MTATKARDVECPRCLAEPGDMCRTFSHWYGMDLYTGYHPERVKAAAAVTRAANREARR